MKITTLFLVLAVNLTGWETLLDEIVKFLPKLLIAVVIFILGLILTKIIEKIMGKALKKSRLDITVHVFLKSLVKIALYTLIIVIALSTLGVSMTSIVAVIGAAGLAVGLALQNSLANLAGGFIILFSKPFVSGDFIESNGVSGTVESISILYTRLLTIDNKAVYIPNGQVSNSKIINFTQEKLRRLEIDFAVSYKNDYEKAITIIKDVIYKNQLAITEPEPLVRVSEQASSSIKITAKVWVSSENFLSLKFDLLEQVKKAFDENNIIIPFNQLDVHIDK